MQTPLPTETVGDHTHQEMGTLLIPQMAGTRATGIVNRLRDHLV